MKRLTNKQIGYVVLITIIAVWLSSYVPASDYFLWIPGLVLIVFGIWGIARLIKSHE